jgi:hypothetical protein
MKESCRIVFLVSIIVAFHYLVFFLPALKPEGKRPLGRPRRRWEDNIKADLREIGIDEANWIRTGSG